MNTGESTANLVRTALRRISWLRSLSHHDNVEEPMALSSCRLLKATSFRSLVFACCLYMWHKQRGEDGIPGARLEERWQWLWCSPWHGWREATDPDPGRRGEFPPLTCYIDKRLFADPAIDP